MLTVSFSHSADVIWDLSPGTVGPGDSAITGGAGTWNTANGNWTTDAGANNIAWDNLNNDTAVFGGTAGAVNLLSNVSVGGLKFNTTGYSITSAANTITFGVDGTIFTNTGVTATIGQKVLSGSATVEKTGSGILTLGNNLSTDTTTNFTGALKISEGTVRLAAYFGSTKTVGSFILNGGALHGWAGYGISQTTTNVSVTANSTISAGESGSASGQDRSLALGALSIGANTLTLTKHSGSSATTVSFTSTTLSGNAVFDVLAGSYSPNTKANLGNLSDGGAGRTITKNGPGDLTWGTITLSGNHIWNVNQGTLISGAITTAGFSLTKNGIGTLNVTGALTGGGNVVLNGGTLNLANTTNTAGTLTLSASSTLGMGTGSTSFSSSVADWDTPNVNLILTGTLGQATTSLRFGTDSTGLSANQLARITYNGLASGVAKPVSLDASGYIRSTAYDGNWNVNADGDWTDITKWTAGQASGADSTATLANNITLDRVINLNTGVTVGHISALDASNNYTISGGNILTLDTTTGIPSVSVGTAARTLIISSEIQGNDGLNKIGAGILLLSGSNSYTGGTTVTAGTLSIGHANALGGAGSGTIALNGGTIQSDGATPRSFSNAVTIGGNFTVGGAANMTFSNTGASALGATRTITVSNAGVRAAFAQAFSGTAGITKAGAGTLVLSGASTYDGVTDIQAGILEINSIGSVNGSAANLGIPTSAANGKIQIRSGAALVYTGDTATTDRQIASAGVTSTFTVDQSGTGLLKFTTAISPGSNGGLITMVLQGSTAGTGEFSGAISDTSYANRRTAVTKSGTGTWTLSGANGYTGATTVNGGKLVIGGGSLDNTAITVNNAGSAFAVTPGSGTINLGTITAGTAGATLNLTNGTSFSMLDGATGTANLKQQVSFVGNGLTLNTATLNFEVGASAADKLAVIKGAGAGAATVSGTNVINVAGVTSIGAGPYDLITAASGLSGTYNFGGSGTSSQTVAVGANAYDLTLSSSATAVTVTVGAPTAIASGVTWTGKTNGTGANNSNWDNAISNNWAANTTASAVSNGTAVTFGDTNASDGGAAIGNSTVNVAASGVTPTSTTFNNSSVNYIVGGGAIGGTGGLTKSGSGSLTLSSINTYTGATNVDAGTLSVSSTGNINSTSSINVASGGNLRYNSSTALTVAPTLAGNGSSNRAVLSGAGSIGVAITLDNLGDVLSPGNSPGIQTYTTAQSWSSFTYDWEVNDFTGLDAGTAFDQLGLTTLNLSGGSGSYVLNVLGLTAGNTTGLVPNFSEINRSWTILTTSGGISNFNAASWSINTTGFSDPDTGNWSLAQNGNDLVLSYNVIPEPHVSLLGGLGVLLLLGRRRRH